MGNGNNGSKGGNLLSRVAYSFGNVGQSAFYNALSTYFIVYVTSSLFAGVDKGVATKLIGIITGLVVVIRIAEIFIDPLLGNIIDNTNTKWGRFKPWQLIGGTVSAILLVLVYTGLFGLVNVNTTLFIVLFIITFIVLDVFYSLRDISYWGMIPALSSDSHERSTYTALGSFGGSIGYNGLTIVVIPIVTYFSWVFTGKYVESQSGWTCFAIIVAILGILTVCSVAFGTKESTTTLRAKAEDNGGPLQAFKALAQNDQLLWVALSYLLYAIANVATTGVLMYLFKYILDNTAAYSIVGVIPVITGLVMAPHLAPIQVVIIPIYRSEEQLAQISEKVNGIVAKLKALGISVKFDDADNKKPGWKFAEYELKGVPVRLAMGGRDLENNTIEVMRRDTLEKETVTCDNIETYVQNLLEEIQKNIFQKALDHRTEKTITVDTYEEFKEKIEEGYFIMAHWDGTPETEEQVKNETKATIRCIPLEGDKTPGKCMVTGRPSAQRVLFARAY